MTGRTHDLAAFTALSYVITSQPLNDMTFGTALIAFSANMIGGLAPDIDQPTANLYRRVRGGNILARLITPMLGGHRFISHSIIGIFLFGFVVRELLDLMTFLVVDKELVWWSFMIGFVSHLVMDTFNKEGVPWFFPIPIHFGIPPLRIFRVKAGGLIEKSFIFPGLLIVNAFMYYMNYHKVLDLLKHYLK